MTDPFDIRYIKLHFTLRFTEDTTVPVYKASALRGGMGEMLLRSNCVRDRNCDACDFMDECIVRRMMYAKMETIPDFMHGGEGIGYVIECEDYHDDYKAGDEMGFNLILFGKLIVYFSQYLNAFYGLGMNGLGRQSSRFEIVQITNTEGKPLLDGNDIRMERLKISTVRDYVSYRRKKFSDGDFNGEIRFRSPLSLKYRKEMLSEFRLDALLEGISRRITILDCFEGNGAGQASLDISLAESFANQQSRKVRIPRYSNHQGSKMSWEGIEGKASLTNFPEDLLNWLLAGELTHVGKNTSFGFGRYRVEEIKRA